MINYQVMWAIIMVVCVVVAFISGCIKHEGKMCLFYLLAIISFFICLMCARDVRNGEVYATIKLENEIIANNEKVAKIRRGKYNTEVWFEDGAKYEVDNNNIIVVDKKLVKPGKKKNIIQKIFKK